MKKYQVNAKIPLNKNFHLCALGDKNEDSCLADSGGPLVCFPKNRDKYCSRAWLFGTVSFGVKCGLLPGIYTPVARYHDWIMTNAERVGPSQYDPLYDCTSETNLC